MSAPAWRRRRQKLYGQFHEFYTAAGGRTIVVYQPGKLELRRQKRNDR